LKEDFEYVEISREKYERLEAAVKDTPYARAKLFFHMKQWFIG